MAALALVAILNCAGGEVSLVTKEEAVSIGALAAIKVPRSGSFCPASIATLFVSELKALLTADAVYNGAHLYLQEKHLESWLERLGEFEAYVKKLGAAIYLGHGAPGGTELIDRTRGYLRDFAEAVKLGSGAAAQQHMRERYADYRVKPFLTMFSIPAYFPAVGS